MITPQGFTLSTTGITLLQRVPWHFSTQTIQLRVNLEFQDFKAVRHRPCPDPEGAVSVTLDRTITASGMQFWNLTLPVLSGRFGVGVGDVTHPECFTPGLRELA
ncbi:MAG: hypothetical protein ACKO2P_10435 [Planctomycetota bacterium]